MRSTKRVLGVVFSIVALIVPTAGGAEPDATPRLRVLIPAYFYPAGRGLKEWDKLIASPGRSAVVAIVNPASGPGRTADANYVALIARAKKAGVTLIGYITVSYGKRPVADVKADVDQWLRLYPGIDGIFFDEQASGAKEVDGQAALYQYVRKTKKLSIVVTNPGTVCDEAYLSRPAADSVCVFEGPRAADSLRFPFWTSRYAPSRFTALPYKVADADAMRICIREAVENRVGLLYITDAEGSMPWGRLPRYWDEELEAVAAVNRDAAKKAR